MKVGSIIAKWAFMFLDRTFMRGLYIIIAFLFIFLYSPSLAESLFGSVLVLLVAVGCIDLVYQVQYTEYPQSF